MWRPTPLVRARNLERALKTPARIYFKDESHSPAGSHKTNTAVPQAYYNRIEGIRRLTTETGAGQWGSAMSFACKQFDIECKVFMVKVSYHQKPYRRSMMHMWGGHVVASPSNETESGRAILAADPDSPGSLGIAISEAVEAAVRSGDTRYTLGSVLNHVMLHQTVIGLEVERQMAEMEDFPDIMIACCGGGSNFAGLTFPFVPQKLKGKEIRFVGVEPCSCPTMSRGQFRYDFGDTTKLTPLIKMFTLGHSFVPPGIHAGGLRYHGMSPLVSLALKLGIVEAASFHQLECFEAAQLFAATEGTIPAPRRRTPSAPRSWKQNAAARKAPRNASCSISVDMACAISAPTIASSAANSKTTSIPRKELKLRSRNCLTWTISELPPVPRTEHGTVSHDACRTYLAHDAPVSRGSRRTYRPRRLDSPPRNHPTSRCGDYPPDGRRRSRLPDPELPGHRGPHADRIAGRDARTCGRTPRNR